MQRIPCRQQSLMVYGITSREDLSAALFGDRDRIYNIRGTFGMITAVERVRDNDYLVTLQYNGYKQQTAIRFEA